MIKNGTGPRHGHTNPKIHLSFVAFLDCLCLVQMARVGVRVQSQGEVCPCQVRILLGLVSGHGRFGWDRH